MAAAGAPLAPRGFLAPAPAAVLVGVAEGVGAFVGLVAAVLVPGIGLVPAAGTRAAAVPVGLEVAVLLVAVGLGAAFGDAVEADDDALALDVDEAELAADDGLLLPPAAAVLLAAVGLELAAAVVPLVRGFLGPAAAVPVLAVDAAVLLEPGAGREDAVVVVVLADAVPEAGLEEGRALAAGLVSEAVGFLVAGGAALEVVAAVDLGPVAEVADPGRAVDVAPA